MLNKVTCGNCLDLMRELPDNSIDSVITDPPYGLSNHSTEDVSECLSCWINGEPYTHGSTRKGKKNCACNLLGGFDVGMGDANNADTKSGEELIPFRVFIDGSLMARCVEFDDSASFGEVKVNTYSAPRDVEDLLVCESNSAPDECFSNSSFILRHTNKFVACNNVCTCFTQCDTSNFSILIGLSDNSFCKPECASGVVALHGTELRAVLSLDVRRRTGELSLAKSALGNNGLVQPVGAELVRALTGTSCLASPLEAGNIRGVDDATNRACTDNYITVFVHVDCLQRLTNPIIPRGGMMGKAWDSFVPGPEVWKECYRVLKPGGTILCFAGSRTQDLMGMALRLSGFEISDAIVYHFGSGFPKSHNIGKSIDKLRGNERDAIGVSKGKGYSSIQEKNIEQDNRPYVAGLPYERADRTLTKGTSEWEGYGTALKPSYEIILMGRKPCEGTFAQNAEKWGIAGLNIDGGRIALEEGDDTKRVVGGHKTSYIGGTLDKNYPIELQANRDKGRWPANTILSCACEGEHAEDCPVRIMDEQSGVSKPKAERRGAKGGNTGALGAFAGSTPTAIGIWPADAGGGASRFFYCAKPSKSEKNLGLDGFPTYEIYTEAAMQPKRDIREQVKVPNHHPTCKPLSLMKYLCKLTRPPHGGIVLDPFTGSGTTGIAAILEGREFIGFELSQEYTDIANARIEHHAKQAQEDLCLSI